MVRQWQKVFYDGRFSATQPERGTDIAAVAKAFGVKGMRIKNPSQAKRVFKKALLDGQARSYRLPHRPRLRGAPDDTARRRYHDGYLQIRRNYYDSEADRFGALSETARAFCSEWRDFFARRGYNIRSLTVSETEHPEFSRMTVVSEVEPEQVKQVEAQLLKLEDVIKVAHLEEGKLVSSELPPIDSSTASRRTRRTGPRRPS